VCGGLDKVEYTNKRSDGGPGEDKSAAYIAYANKVFLRVIFVPAVLITAWLQFVFRTRKRME